MENHANRKIAATVKKKVPVRGLPPIPQKDIRILQPMENLQEDNLKKKDKKKLTEKRREEYDKKGKDMKLLSPEDVHGCIYFKSKIGREDFKKSIGNISPGKNSWKKLPLIMLPRES